MYEAYISLEIEPCLCGQPVCDMGADPLHKAWDQACGQPASRHTPTHTQHGLQIATLKLEGDDAVTLAWVRLS